MPVALGKSAIGSVKKKLNRQNAMPKSKGKPQRPWEDINTIFDNKTDQFKPLSAKKSEKMRRKAGGSPQAAPQGTKPGGKPDNLPQRPWEDINTIFDNKTDQFKPLSAKKSEKLRRNAGGNPQATPVGAVPNAQSEAAEPKKGGFFSNGLVQTIGGTLVGTLGVSALTSMFSGGGASAEAAPAPAPTPAPAANPYDPYAASGSFGVPGSLPNYF